jgi:hypothetical protein
MNRILPYILIILLLIIFVCILKNSVKKSNEKYDSEDKRPPGPWGPIGQGHPWYDYPYILHNIEYFKK